MINKRINRNNPDSFTWKEPALVILVLAYSVNPALTLVIPLEPQLVVLATFLGILLFKKSNKPFSEKFLLISGIFTIIMLIQCISFSYYPFVTMAGFLTRLFIGYGLMQLVGNFSQVYVRAVVLLALISLSFHIPYSLLLFAGIGVDDFIIRLADRLGTATPYRWPLFFHTFLADYPPRNAGFFWEPGAFVGYLITGLVFLSIIKKDINKKDYKLYLIALSIALLSTRSTTGYIVYPFALLLHYDWGAVSMRKQIERGLLACFVVIPIIVTISIYSYTNLSFLQDKVEKQLNAVEYSRKGWHLTRFGTLVFDWEYIKKRPLFGWGLHENTRYAMHPHMKTIYGMGNGFSDFAAKFGITGFLTWFGAVLIGLQRLMPKNRFKPIYIMFIISLLLQGEQFLNHPFWLGLAFLQPYFFHHESYSSTEKPVKKQFVIRW